MGANVYREEIIGQHVGGKVGELSANIGRKLLESERSAIQMVGAAIMDFADPQVSILRAENRRN